MKFKSVSDNILHPAVHSLNLNIILSELCSVRKLKCQTNFGKRQSTFKWKFYYIIFDHIDVQKRGNRVDYFEETLSTTDLED